MFVYEVDEELTLKMMNTSNVEQLFSLIEYNRDYLQEWLPWVNSTTRVEHSKQFIENAFQTHADRVGLTSGIFYQESLVGVIGFNEFDWRNKIGYIGYWLSKDAQGKGIMTRAVRALTDYGFEILDLNRIDIRAAVDNKKSRAIPERLGFNQEGILRQTEWLYDHYVDHVVYGMLANEWRV